MEGTWVSGFLAPFLYYIGVLPPPVLKRYFWSVIFIGFTVLWLTMIFKGMWQFDYDDESDEIVGYLIVLIQIAATLTGIVVEYFNRKESRDLFKSLRFTDEILSAQRSPVSRMKRLNGASFVLLLLSIVFITVYEMYLGEFRWNVVLICLCQHYYELVATARGLLFVCTVRALVSQLQALNGLLRQKDTVSIEKSILVHDRIWRDALKLNDIQGWNNFGYVSYTFLDAILNSYFFLNPKSKTNQEYASLFWSLFRVFHMIQLTSTCTWAADQCDEFHQTLHSRIINDETYYEDDNDMVYCYILMKRDIHFDAKGFYSLNNEMFITAVSVGTMHIAILLQTMDMC